MNLLLQMGIYPALVFMAFVGLAIIVIYKFDAMIARYQKTKKKQNKLQELRRELARVQHERDEAILIA